MQYAKHYETRDDVKTLPYTFPHFVSAVRATVLLYKELDVVPADAHGPLQALVDCVDAEYERLKQRILGWSSVEKSREQLQEHDRMFRDVGRRDDPLDALAEVENEASHDERHHRAGNSRVARRGTQVLSDGYLSIQSQLPDLQEGFVDDEEDTPTLCSGASNQRTRTADEELIVYSAKAFLDSWQGVLLLRADEALEGCMVQMGWWYEEFMPALAAACSVTSDPLTFDGGASSWSEDALETWFHDANLRGEFSPYAHDLQMMFLHCSVKVKRTLRQAWRLTVGYLNGIQKQREREVETHHRRTGGLSRYVPFLDVYLRCFFVSRAEMRVSFPYYLGYTTWRLLHTVPEIAAVKGDGKAALILAAFKDFFRSLANTYGCPFCRHHLTTYVVQNSERDMYPIEYTLLGLVPDKPMRKSTLEQKLETIQDAMSARLFVWKLHNAVQSSIERKEDWYKQEAVTVYTSRFWPNLSGDLARAQFLQSCSIPTDQVKLYSELLKPMACLEKLREKLVGDTGSDQLHEVHEQAKAYISMLEDVVVKGRFLQLTYSFDPTLKEEWPVKCVTDQRYGEYGRSSEFILW